MTWAIKYKDHWFIATKASSSNYPGLTPGHYVWVNKDTTAYICRCFSEQRAILLE